MRAEAEIKQKIAELRKPAEALIVGEIRPNLIKMLKWVLEETQIDKD